MPLLKIKSNANEINKNWRVVVTIHTHFFNLNMYYFKCFFLFLFFLLIADVDYKGWRECVRPCVPNAHFRKIAQTKRVYCDHEFCIILC